MPAIQEEIPGVEITANYEQVKAMVRDGEVGKIGILYGVTIGAGRELAEDLHKVDPTEHLNSYLGRQCQF